MPIANAKDGCPINYQVEGPADAPVLMLCNSLGTNLHMWDDQAPEWAKHFRLVRYDRRGHGKSGAPKGAYTMDMLGHDALAVADAAGAKKFNWCGLSMGGMVGQWLGANASDRFDKLVLANTTCHLPDPTRFQDRIKAVTRNGVASIADQVIPTWLTEDFRERDPATTQEIRRMFAATPLEGYVGCCEALSKLDQRDLLGRITAPVLIIAGRHDMSTTVEQAEFMRKGIPKANLTLLDAAHLSNVEQSYAFNDALLGFLTQR
jgi:3-oxoadipate enol-lactonase